ncbi:MAG TPA: CDP-alcohol phosphatidyltransferase family protein [Devosiaceae bacterium]|nr:CDP-alcohol phosphatidyltransferase family protein [Devosiaceae bacterium]
MLDGVMRKLIDPPLAMAGRVLALWGISANAMTLAGLAVGLLAALAVALDNSAAALWLIVLSRLADGLDGAIARANGKTDFDGYLDITADFLFYGAIPAAFVIADPLANAAAGAVVLLSFYFNGATFLGYTALAEKRGLETERRGSKSLYFTGGLMEGTETIAFFLAVCIWPAAFAGLAWLFAAATFVTAISRLVHAWQVFGDADSSDQT